jgi:hypothetical protein
VSRPLAEIVISVHDPSRPIARAVGSIVDSSVAEQNRVTVVCHGLPAAAFAAAIDRFRSADVRWVEFDDGIRSPAGPYNHGLSVAEGDHVGVMGSDDFFDPGALEAMVAHLRADRPDVLVYPLRHQVGTSMPNPLSRRGRTERLDAVKDRLAYRTAPLAFVRRSLIAELGLGFTPGMRTGDDVAFTAQLWNSGARIDFHPADPCYVIGADAETRVTTSPMPIEDELAAFFDLFERDRIVGLPARRRAALVTKTLRIHLLGSLVRRIAEGTCGDRELEVYAALARAGVALAPTALRPFSRRDRVILDQMTGRNRPDPAAVRRAVEARAEAGRVRRLTTKNPIWTLAREGELRRVLRYRGWPQ